MSEQNQDKLPFEMAKQLHEQYAANDNAKVTSIIGFLAAIAFIFVGFGTIYVQPYINDTLKTEEYGFLLQSVDIVANVILVLMSILCVFLGYSTRRDHVVITRLRKLYAKTEMGSWFKGKYNGCGKNILTFLPDYYLIIFLFIQGFIVLFAYGCYLNKGAQEVAPHFLWWVIAGVSVTINILLVVRYFYKYDNLQTKDEKE